MISSLLSLLLAGGAWAQHSYLASELSFGFGDRVSPDNSEVPHWTVFGTPYKPDVLSNKIILTPPVQPNQRGAAWCDSTLQNYVWEADIDFRATGPERGDGKLVIWLARNGKYDVGTQSIYTVGRFDGLALHIDTYGGSAGSIRGFLNDGTVAYSSHHSVDSLSFGHCSYPYRNLGRMSALKIVQSPSNFQVLIDGRLCFESSKIRLPLGYNPGITAVSGESPDSFEIGRFVVTTRSHDHDPPSPSADITSENLLNIGQKAADEAGESAHGPPPPVIDIADPNDPPEVPAEKVDSKMQFADLHDRVQALMRHIQAFQRDYVTNNLDMLQRLKAIHHMVSKSQYSSRPDNTPGGTPSSGGPPGGGKWGQEALAKTLDEALAKMERRLEGLEGKVAEMANTLSHVKYAVSDSVGAGHIEDLKRTVREHHSDLLAAGPKGHGFLIFMIVGCQAGIVAAYVLYDRRRGRGEKKYL